MEISLDIKETKNIRIFVDKIENLATKLYTVFPSISKIVILTHRKLWKYYKHKFSSLVHFKTIFLPEGEQTKSLEYLKYLYLKFIKQKLDRSSVLLIFGGGVLGDIGGFAAATYMRGINYVQLPTTLLAMIDSSIGGKTAINLPIAKNLVGSFYQPKIIFCDLNLLQSLPEEEIHNALGEILKYGVLNKKVFNMLYHAKKNFLVYPLKPNYELKKLVIECIKTKLNIVKQDEKELTEVREKLNLGHTIAHAIESITGYKIYSHGKAVILGLIAETYLSRLINLLNQTDYGKILELIKKYTENVKFNTSISKLPPEKILSHLIYDKKVRFNKIRFVLPKEIGVVETVENIDKKYVVESIKFLYQWILKR